MKFLFGLLAFTILSLVLIFRYEEGRDPYEVGMHADYSIVCESGLELEPGNPFRWKR